MNRNLACYFALLVLSLYIEHDRAANIGGSHLQNPVKFGSTILPTSFTMITSSSPLPSQRTTTAGLLASSGPNNFTVQAGSKITLQCQVDQLVDNATVSWLRRFGDSLILVSVGKEMYSSDPRFTSIFLSSQDWRLHIDGVNVTDQGHYECQISSHPPVVRSVYLHVLVPKLEIEDERSLPIKNKFYNSGSTIELKCVISKVPQPTQFIIWKHNSTILNYDTTRGGISVKTDILPDGAESQLNIANVGPTDSGNYTCSLGESAVTSVSVVVITGETPAAMQQGCAKSRVSYGLLLLAVDMAAWSSFS